MADDLVPPPFGLSAFDAELRAWRVAHPEATLTEIEQALDTRLRALRADLLATLAATDAPDASRAGMATPCPACGRPVVARGRHRRTLTTTGDQPLPLTRRYATCPACGYGFFPPR